MITFAQRIDNVIMINYKIPFEKSRPRQHYNSRGKCKQTFETGEDADKYISKHRLRGMKSYCCNVCNKYHIGHYAI